MSQVKQPLFQVIYNGKNITNDITQYVKQINYSDHVKGTLDDIEIILEDKDLKWSNEWYPQKSDTIKVQIGDANKLINCGTFKIDEVKQVAPPSTITIRGTALNITGKMRSKRSVAHENKTLSQIVATIASDNGLTVQGSIPEFMIIRETQDHETDLCFLNRLSNDYGLVFSIRDTMLVFTNIYDLEAETHVTSIDITEVIDFEITDKSFSFKGVQIAYHNPVTSKKINYKIETVQNADGVSFNEIQSTEEGMNNVIPHLPDITGKPSGVGTPSVTDDVHLIHTKTENSQQAQLKAKAALHHYNSRQQEGSATLPGNPFLLAGNNFLFTGIGANTGNYHITDSTHMVDKSNAWKVDIKFKRVGFLDKTKNKPKKKSTPKPTKYTMVK